MEEDVTKDLGEFSIANAIYAALVEAHASEISSRSAVQHLVYINRANLLSK
jgi:F-type H+-transporting ATPase subunit gamma